LLSIPKSANPKGIALFLSSYVQLAKTGLIDDDRIAELGRRLLDLRSSDRMYSCWGYNFDWQSRHILVPKHTPNIICSTFAANALLDAYEIKPYQKWLDASVSAADFILNDLFWQEKSGKACFSYTRLGREEVHNANLLGAALLCRIARVSGDARYLESALAATRYSVGKQQADGSWFYGEARAQQWVDNFHTGFNLVALKKIGAFCSTDEYDQSVRLGFDFYRSHFFRNDGAPRYFHNTTYPIDIHSTAQSLITLTEFRDFGQENIDLAWSVLGWTLSKMWDRRGFFYFQKHRLYTIRTSFMRWSQAWMLAGLAALRNSMLSL
jgi:hypothetical protein